MEIGSKWMILSLFPCSNSIFLFFIWKQSCMCEYLFMSPVCVLILILELIILSTNILQFFLEKGSILEMGTLLTGQSAFNQNSVLWPLIHNISHQLSWWLTVQLEKFVRPNSKFSRQVSPNSKGFWVSKEVSYAIQSCPSKQTSYQKVRYLPHPHQYEM